MKIVVDFSHIAHACWPLVETKGVEFWKNMIFNMVLKYRNLFQPTEIIIACDGDDCWRRDYFRYYKVRKKQRLLTNHDYKFFKDTLSLFINEISNLIPWVVLRHQRCEADDIIATVIFYYQQDEFTIISKDKDFFQLHRNGVTQYDPIKDEFIGWKEDQSIYDHILRGDSSDEVPNFLSDDDVFVSDDKKQHVLKSALITKLKEKGFEKKVTKTGTYEYFIPHELTQWVQNQFKKNHEVLTRSRVDIEIEKLCKNVDRNKRMIDLTYVPRELKQQIIEMYNQEKNRVKQTQITPLEEYLYSQKMVKNLSRIHSFFPEGSTI